jgi:hypothetical protein
MNHWFARPRSGKDCLQLHKKRHYNCSGFDSWVAEILCKSLALFYIFFQNKPTLRPGYLPANTLPLKLVFGCARIDSHRGNDNFYYRAMADKNFHDNRLSSQRLGSNLA